MAQSESWARRLLREMTSPHELLSRDRYRTPVFLRIFLDHVEEVRFRDTRSCLKLSAVATQLALRVPEEASARGRRKHRERLVRAHAVRGASYRVADRLAASEVEYEAARNIAAFEAIAPVARADLSSRLATLRAWQNRFDEALELVDDAEGVYHSANDQRRLSENLAVRGFVLNQAGRFPAATRWHGKALTLALRLERTRPSDPAEVAALARVVESARFNLANCVFQAPSPGPGLTATTALAYIADAHRELRGRRNILTRHLLQWTEGEVYMKLCLHHRAEMRFIVARRGFARLDAPWETALVSLDLAALYRLRSEWASLEHLAMDTSRRFRELCGDFEANVAISLWVDAVEARRGIEAAIGAARQTIETRKRRFR